MDLIERLKAKNEARLAKETANATPEETNPPREDQTSERVGEAQADDATGHAGPATESPSGAGDSASQEPTKTPEAKPGLKAPLRRPVRRAIVKPAAPTPVATDTSATPTPEPAKPAKPEPPAVPERKSALSIIKTRATARANGEISAVNPAAMSAIEAGETSSAEKMLADLQEVENNIDEDDEDELNRRRAEILTAGAHRIEEIFATELAGLEIEDASDYALKEMSQISKLTFMRVKSAPIAWKLMDRADQASLIKAMRAMAAKRESAVTSRAKNKKQAAELSDALNTMNDVVDAVPEEALAIMGDIGFEI